MAYRIFENKKRDIAILIALFVVSFLVVTLAPRVIRFVETNQKNTAVIQVELTPELRKQLQDEVASLEKKTRKEGLTDNTQNDFVQLALNYQQLGLLGKAAKVYQQIVSFNKKNIQASLNLGDVYRLMGDYERAKAQYRATIEVQPKDPLLYQKLAGLYHSELDNDEQARGVFIEGLFQTGNNADLMRSFALFLEGQGEYSEAYLYWNELLKKDPKDATAKEHLNQLKSRVRSEIMKSTALKKK